MTISTEIRKAGPYTGNGSTTAFAFSFKVFTTAQVLVTRAVIATGAETTLTLTADYTVSLNADQNANPGGTVTVVTAPTSAQSITITSNVPNLQPTAVANLGAFYPEVVNDGLDRATMQIQQLDERLDRALIIPVSSTASGQLPTPQSSALIGWDAGATTLQNYNSTPVGSTTYQYVHRVIATAGQTAFTLPVAYVLNAAALEVFVNGLRLEQGAGLDWVETDTTTVTFNSGLASGDLVTFIVNILSSVVPIAAFPAASVSAFGASLVDDADAAAARATLGLGSLAVINSPLPIVNGGTGATTAGAALTALGGQPLDATLTALAGLATGANKFPYSTGTDTFSQADLTSFARTLLDDADAPTARVTLGLGAQSGTGETTGVVVGSGSAIHPDATFTGNVGSTAYTISDIVKALKNLGLLAS